MWIKFKKTYSGPEGVFAKGRRIELPAEKVNRIKSKFYEKSCPPWEDHLDRAAVDQAAARDAMAKANQHLSNLQAAAGNAAEKVSCSKKAFEDLAERTLAIDGLIEKAEKRDAKKSKQLGDTKTPRSNKEKDAYAVFENEAADARTELAVLMAEQKRLPALAQKAEGQLTVAHADQQLIEIELAEAKADIESLKGFLGIKETDNDDSKEPAAETEGEQGDDQITEGPADKTKPKTD